MNRYIDLTVMAFIVLLAGTQEAQAYIDPGSGSIVMTAILGFIAAVGYTARKYFYKVKRLFGGKPQE